MKEWAVKNSQMVRATGHRSADPNWSVVVLAGEANKQQQELIQKAVARTKAKCKLHHGDIYDEAIENAASAVDYCTCGAAPLFPHRDTCAVIIVGSKIRALKGGWL